MSAKLKPGKSIEGCGKILPDVAYTVDGACKEMGVTQRWFRDNLIDTGAIPIVLFGGRRRTLEMFAGHALVAWISQNAAYRKKDSKPVTPA